MGQLAMLLTVPGRFDHALCPTALCSNVLACGLPTSREMLAIEISAELSLPPSWLSLQALCDRSDESFLALQTSLECP